MFYTFRLFFLLLVLMGLVAVTGCRTKKTIPGFDSVAWKNDAYACQDIRSKMLPRLKLIRHDLRGLSIRQLMDVLGKPDLETLLANNQRIYHYYLFPGTQCQNKQKLSSANKLLVRFNALEQVSEVLFEQPVP